MIDIRILVVLVPVLVQTVTAAVVVVVAAEDVDIPFVPVSFVMEEPSHAVEE